MPRRVYFSFHYDRDITRVNVVRNCQVIQSGYMPQQFIDKADFEPIKRKGDKSIKNWIDKQMHGTSVIVVLIGLETYSRDYVIYEIGQAFFNKMGMLGIHINNIRNFQKEIDPPGENPFENVEVMYRGEYRSLIEVVNHNICCYDWVKDDGRYNIGDWIEEAARNANR